MHCYPIPDTVIAEEYKDFILNYQNIGNKLSALILNFFNKEMQILPN